MKINYYVPESHIGSQPIRVLYQNTKYWFKHIYPEFDTTEFQKAIKEFCLYEDINIIDREERIGCPAYVGTFKIISIQETFLSYLWCTTYSLLYLYDKTIHETRLNETFVISNRVKEKASKAHDLFKYGLSLLDRYNPWDKEKLPNPELYDRFDDDYIEKTNAAYLNAVNFILFHELGHVILGHIDNDIENEEKGIKVAIDELIQNEIEADDFSFDRMFRSPENLTNSHTVSVGVISGLCSFLFFSANLKGIDHPDFDKRLQTALEKLNLADEDNLWGISCLAFKLWAINHRLNLKWPTVVETYKDLFYITIKELESIKNNKTNA